jgi:hypothetical protein
MHTTGPWHRNIPANGKYPTVFAGRNQHVAVATQQKNSEETEANISLIAAAPDLLAALESLMPYVNGIHWSQVAAAKAAIAKATGREA